MLLQIHINIKSQRNDFRAFLKIKICYALTLIFKGLANANDSKYRLIKSY